MYTYHLGSIQDIMQFNHLLKYVPRKLNPSEWNNFYFLFFSLFLIRQRLIRFCAYIAEIHSSQTTITAARLS